MEMRGTLAELLTQAMALTEVPDAEPMQLYVLDEPVITTDTESMICNENSMRGTVAALVERYRYVLMLRQVRAILDGWRVTAGRDPTPDEACWIVMHVSEFDTPAPVTPLPCIGNFVWVVQHRRGERPLRG